MTQTEFDTQVTNYQCCLAQTGSNLVDLLRAGDRAADCYTFKFLGLAVMIEGLKDYVITDDCITASEICTTLDRINVLCSECCS